MSRPEPVQGGPARPVTGAHREVTGVRWRPIVIAGLICAAVAGAVIWLQHARLMGHWLEVHTGTVNEPGPYYGVLVWVRL